MRKALLLPAVLPLGAALLLAGCQSAGGGERFSSYIETYGEPLYEPSEDGGAADGDYADDTRQLRREVETNYLWGAPIKELACRGEDAAEPADK